MDKKISVSVGGYVFTIKRMDFDSYMSYGWNRQDPENMDRVLNEHVLAYIDLNGELKDFLLEDMTFQTKPGILIALYNKIYEISGIEDKMNEENFVASIDAAKNYVMGSLQGLYDIFILKHLGLDALQMARKSYEDRLLLIAISESMTGISVRDRRKHAMDTDTPIDLENSGDVSDAGEIDIDPMHIQDPALRKRAIMAQKLGMNKKHHTPEDTPTQDLAKQYQHELQKKLNEERRIYESMPDGKNRAFNWDRARKEEAKALGEPVDKPGESKSVPLDKLSGIPISKESMEFNS